MNSLLDNFTDLFDDDEVANSQPLSLPSTSETISNNQSVQLGKTYDLDQIKSVRQEKGTGQSGDFRSVQEIDIKYRDVFTYPYFNFVQSSVIEDALYSDKSMVVCAPTGSGKTVVFEMAVVQLLMELEHKNYAEDFKIIYMAPVKALCTERLSEWYPKFTKLGLNCIEVTGDTNVDFSQLKPYKVIVTTPEKWDMLTRRWRDHRGLVEVIKLFLIDEVHILNDDTRGPVLEAVVSRMKTIEESSQSAHRIEQLQKQYAQNQVTQELQPPYKEGSLPRIRFVAVSATIANPEDVAAWLGTEGKPAVYYKFGDESRPVKLKRLVEGYPCPEGMSIFKFDIILNYKLWPIIQKYHDGKPTLIFCNTRKSVALTAETLSRELTISFTPEQMAKLTALASTIKNKKLQALVLSGVGCHHAGLLYEERLNIEQAFRNRDLPILITTTTLAMGVNLPAHLVIIKNTQQYVNGAYQEYSISTVLQMIGRAGRPQFDTEATAVIMTRLGDKHRYQSLVGGSEPLQSYLHKRLPENLNSEAALGTVGDVAQCVQWLRSTFLSVRAARDPKRYLGLPLNAPPSLITKKIEELCVKAMNGLASSGLITMDEASCIESTEAGRLMSIFYLDLETMKLIMKIEGTETLECLLGIICECHELADMHLRVDERRTLNTLNRNNAAATIRFPMKGKISSRQMKLNCIIQAVLGCLPIPDPALNQEAMKVMRIADRVCKCLVAYVTRPDLITTQPQYFSAVINSLVLAKCIAAHLWENSPYVSKQLKGIGPTFSTLLASAGKVNFTLLEESHPRDLERIMNKGAPAGNVLRKQVSLLPKYQLTATPIDERRVSVQLMLLNQNHLTENMGQLTAGGTHRCYVAVGDSENHVLLFTSFKDRDLINIYDGTLTYEVTRKHNFEHTISVHCISATWVGIDAQCDYVFKTLEPTFARGEATNTLPLPYANTSRKPISKQTTITDTFKQRKRRNNDTNVTQCKEKKKRDNTMVEKFKLLKDSFEATSKQIKYDLSKSAQVTDTLIHEMVRPEKLHYNTEIQKKAVTRNSDFTMDNDFDVDKRTDVTLGLQNTELSKYGTINLADLDEEENFIVDERIDSILNKIENEIYKDKNASFLPNSTRPFESNDKPVNTFSARQVRCSFFNESNNVPIDSHNSNQFAKLNQYKINATKKRKPQTFKSNYSFIDNLEKNDTSDVDEPTAPQNNTGFSDAIKAQIDQFLKKTSHFENPSDVSLEKILNFEKPEKNIIDLTELKDKIPKSSLISKPEPNIIDLSDVQEVFDKNDCETDKTEPTVLPVINICDNEIDGINNSINCRKGLQNIGPFIEIDDENHAKTHKKERNNDENSNTDLNKCNSSINSIFQYEVTENEIDDNLRGENNIIKCKSKETANFKRMQEHRSMQEQNRKYEIGNNFFEEYRSQFPETHSLTTKSIENPVINENYDLKPAEVFQKEFIQFQNTKAEPPYNTLTRKENFAIEQISNGSKPIATNSVTETVTNYNISSNNTNELIFSFNNNIVQNAHLLNNQVVQSTSQNRVTCNSSASPFYHGTVEHNIISDANNILKNCSQCFNYSAKEPSLSLNCERRPNNVNYTQSSEEHLNYKMGSQYMNNYSLSATKFDVSTKNTSDHQVKIIRKLKLDLDITEIVAKREKKSDVHKEKSKPENKNLNKVKEHIHECRDEPDQALDERFKNIENNTDKHIKDISSRYQHLDLDTISYEKNTDGYSIKFDENVNTLKSICFEQEVSTLTQNVDNGRDNQIKPGRCDSVGDTDNLNEKSSKDENKKYADVNVENLSNSKPDDETPNVRKDQTSTYTNKVENILQKYSSVLRKNEKSVFNIDTTIKDLETKKRTTTEKAAKSYKITDIHHVQIPLPKTLVSVGVSRNSQPTNHAIPSRIKEVGIKKNNPKNLDNSKLLQDSTSKYPTVSDSTREIGESSNVYIEELPDCLSPIQLEPSEEFNLDQSMFNPQMLLQHCFLKEDKDEIIPPPGDFADSCYYSPTYSPTQTENFLLNSSTSQEYPNLYSSGLDHDENAFEGKFSTLTPSKEIETWTLSQEFRMDAQSNLAHTNYLNQPKCCTALRNSPLTLQKLQHFKFKHKNKLRI